ncbi:ArsR/SmtB family transcription factor [Sphingobium tyrosinilyticum]|uniref:ArsR/SmtB family transcription factor n=1 Tax=Sphingobium tyrosinilyticum TaxID=2715436 RepID=A0ABV9EY50_9SPHN
MPEQVGLPDAVGALSALAHGHRLAVFRLLVRAGAEGVAAGEISREVGVLPSTLSTHLNILGHAGLVQSRREGRSVIYSADFKGMRDLLSFLVSDCCGGRPEICAPLAEIAEAAQCCPPR